MTDKKEEKVILYSSPEAAEFKTVSITGWFSSKNHYYGNTPTSEHQARYDGCTHMICDKCGEGYKQNSWCRMCAAKREMERYYARPETPLAADMVIFSETLDKYFFDASELEDEIADMEEPLKEDLRLVVCEPNICGEFEIDDFYSEELPEDQYIKDVFPELAEAIEAANRLIRETQKVLSWVPGKFRTSLKQEKKNETKNN